MEAFYSQVIQLTVGKNVQSVILKDVQRHPAREDAMHLDFQRVDASHVVTLTIPLHFVNEEKSAGIKAGGVAVHNLQEVEVQALPSSLPEFIAVDMSAVEVDQTVHLSDLQVPEGVTLVQLGRGADHDLPVVHINPARKEAQAAGDDQAEEKA